jgi:hypothetical protein
MWMQMKLFTFIVMVVLSAVSAGAQGKESDFCASRTPQALHSVECKWAFVVQDPHRVNDVKIPHEPIYHTFSRWVLGDQRYIFAYRDIDQQPEDMMVDIYLAANGGYKRIGSVEITGMVTGVFTAKLTGQNIPDVVFQYEGGELHYVTIMRAYSGEARQVFRYGASTIDVLSQPTPLIVATSNLTDQVEQFAWDAQTESFRKIEQSRVTQ